MRYAQTFRIALILSCVALGAHAQEPISKDERELAGHRFISSSRLPDPFVTTHARFRTSGGLATGFQSIYKVPGADSIRVTEGSIGFFGLDFEYQQNLFERTSARLSLEGNARVGVDNESMLGSGLSSAYGFEFEGKYRFLRREKMILAGHALISHKNLFGLVPLRFAEGILEDGYDESDQLVTEGHLNRLVFGPSMAWAPRPGLGLTGHVLVGPADPFDSDTPDDTAFRWGVTADLDLKEFAWFPIGLMAGYDYDSLPEVNNQLVEGIPSGTFQVAYTGRDDFSLGLEITYSDIKQKDFPDVFGSTLFSINSRYYF